MDIIRLDRNCPICGSSSGEKLIELNFKNQKDNNLPEHYDVVVCDKCGFAFSSMQANQDDYNKYYANCNSYAYAENLRIEDNLAEPRLVRIVDIIQENYPFDASIIDIGCGGGELLQIMSKRGFSNICGLDPSDESINKLNENNIKGYLGNIFSAEKLDIGKFDVVVSTAVVEHVYDLEGYIIKLSSLVRPGGSIVLNAPAVESFDEYILPVANYFNQEHINYFSAKTLDNLMGCYLYLRENEDPYVDNFGELQLCVSYKNASDKRQLVYDKSSKEHICSYLAKYSEMRQNCENTINELILARENIVIWGTGSYTKQLLASFPELKDICTFFIDNNKMKQGTSLCEREIKPAEALNSVGQDTAILICSMKNGKDIEKQIRELGLKNKTVIV